MAVQYKPTIVFIITKLELGGAQKVCLSLMKELKQHGHRVYLISGTEGPLVQEAERIGITKLLPTFTHEIGSFTNEWKNFNAVTHELKKLKTAHPDLIVHTHSTKAGLIGRWAAWRAGITQRIHTVHGYGFHARQSWAPWLVTYVLELATSVITTHYVCVSSADIQTGIKVFPRFKKKSSIIRAAVSNTHFIPAALATPKSHFTFGTITCFKKQKNLFDLLKSFEQVYRKNNKTRLEIIGDGHLRPAIEAWISEHKLTEVIALHGWQEHVAPIMMDWDAFVLSSLWEGLPCAIVEARLLKLPIISYRTGGIPDIITHGVNGLLCEQTDWQTLAQHMYILTQQPTLSHNLGKYQDNLDEFKETTMGRRHSELYNKYL